MHFFICDPGCSWVIFEDCKSCFGSEYSQGETTLLCYTQSQLPVVVAVIEILLETVNGKVKIYTLRLRMSL